jgi:hypothetical protein
MSKNNFAENWNEFRPSKGLWIWSCVGCIIATVILGFAWGGWVTGGTAAEMAANAAEDARTEVAAAVCVNKFVASANAGAQLTTLKDASSWERDGLVEEGGWSTIPGLDKLDDVAEVCAERLVAMEALPAPVATEAVAETDDI